MTIVERINANKADGAIKMGLNPCCSGRWSRTRPHKTILIINMLRNSTKQFFTFLNRKLTFS